MPFLPGAAHTCQLVLLCLPAQQPRGPWTTSTRSRCFWIPITICRRLGTEQTSRGICGMRHRMSLGERPVLEGPPHPASRGCSEWPALPHGALTKMALCPLALAPGLPPSIPPSLPGPHCFRECPHPKGEVPWSDSCPEPPWCLGEYAWRGRVEGLGELVLPLWLTVVDTSPDWRVILRAEPSCIPGSPRADSGSELGTPCDPAH